VIVALEPSTSVTIGWPSASPSAGVLRYRRAERRDA
jgi:hypothetical protein